MKRDATFSGFLAETFELIGDGIVYLGIFVFVVGGVNSIGVVFDLVQPSNRIFGLGFHVDGQTGAAAAAFGILAAAIGIVAKYFLTARLLSVRDSLSSGSTRIWAFIGMQILWLLGIIVGFILLFVPAIILIVRWSATDGFLIGSRKGIRESFSESWRATSGHSWAIFFAGLILLIGLAIAGGVVRGLFGMLGSSTLTEVTSAIMETVGNATLCSFGVAVFYLLWDDSEEMVKVFS